MKKPNSISLTGKWIGYFASSALTSLSGLVFLPWHARLLSLTDYGLLVTGETLLSVASVLVTAGLPQAVVRFLPRYGKRDLTSTVLAGHALLCVLGLILSSVLLPFLPRDSRIIYALFAGLAVVNSSLDVATSFLRAEQAVVRYGAVSVLARYIPLLFGILVYRRFGNLSALLSTRLLCTVLVLGLSYVLLGIQKGPLSSTRFREVLRYGTPLIGLALSSVILSVGDRLVIQFWRGSEEVARYAATYGLANGLVSLLVAPFNLLVQPMYMQRWEADGQPHTQVFLNQALAWYTAILVPALSCLLIGAPRLVEVFLGHQYADAVWVVPIVGAGVAIYGMYFITGAGLFLRKETPSLVKIIGSMAIFNLLLNLVVVHLWGLHGAAISTLVTYTCFVYLASRRAFETVRVRLSKRMVRVIVGELLLTGVVFWTLLTTVPGWIGLLAGGLAAAAGCLVLIYRYAPDLLRVEV